MVRSGTGKKKSLVLSVCGQWRACDFQQISEKANRKARFEILSMEQSQTRYQLNEKDVVSELLDGEVVVIHLQSGTYYSMLASAADIWGALVGGWSAEEIAEQLDAGGDRRQHIKADVMRFLETLVAEELIVPVAGDSCDEPRADFQPTAPFAAPELQKYTDMQELLLVDPIHEVTDQGWPNREN